MSFSAKRWAVLIVGSNIESAAWFTDPDEVRAHLDFLKSMPVDGGAEFELVEYTLTRVAIHQGTST